MLCFVSAAAAGADVSVLSVIIDLHALYIESDAEKNAASDRL